MSLSMDAPAGTPKPATLAGSRSEAVIRAGLRAGLVWWPCLTAMAAADGFGFWNTLTRILRRDTTLILVFVTALAIASVLVPHVIGGIVRSRREGYGGSLLWVIALTVPWLSLGVTMAWLRAHQPTAQTSAGPSSSGVFGSGPQAAADQSPGFALLIAGLYLCTGALAMTHAYLFGDPRAAHMRAALRLRDRRARQLVHHQHRHERAVNRHRQHVDADRSDDADRDQRHQPCVALGDLLRQSARLDLARHLGDPAATDAAVSTPHPRDEPRHRADHNGVPTGAAPAAPPPSCRRCGDPPDPAGEE